MKLGIKKAEMPEVKLADAGKAALKIVGVGLAAGVALIAATNTTMTKLTSKNGETADADEPMKDEE